MSERSTFSDLFAELKELQAENERLREEIAHMEVERKNILDMHRRTQDEYQAVIARHAKR